MTDGQVIASLLSRCSWLVSNGNVPGLESTVKAVRFRPFVKLIPADRHAVRMRRSKLADKPVNVASPRHVTCCHTQGGTAPHLPVESIKLYKLAVCRESRICSWLALAHRNLVAV